MSSSTRIPANQRIAPEAFAVRLSELLSRPRLSNTTFAAIQISAAHTAQIHNLAVGGTMKSDAMIPAIAQTFTTKAFFHRVIRNTS